MIQVLQRAITILEYLAREPETPRTLGEIAAHAELNAATCARILKTLMDTGYADQEAPKKGYLLGPQAYALAAKGPYRKDLILAAEPELQRLAMDTGETVLLAALRRGRRLVLLQLEGDQTVQVRGDRLQVYDPYQTATGRLLLAYLDAAALESLLQEIGLPTKTWPEADTHAKLVSELARIRRDGEVIRRPGESVVGLARPIFQGKSVVAALGLYLPAHRYEGAHREKVHNALNAAAVAVSASLSNDRYAREQ